MYETCVTHLQVVGNQMPVLAAGTCDQDCAVVVALLGHAVRRTGRAWLASKGHFI
jgi:hypothetical protein